MTPPKSTQAQIDAIAEQQAAMRSIIEGLERQLADEVAMRTENHAMLTALTNSLMVAQPGQNGKSLLDRIADVTVQIESGKRTANNLVTFAKWLAALGALGAAVKFGIGPKG
jgi:6-phosphogluconate dehydrogenase